MDYGCGSGILGIAALLLGAASVVAVDNDIQALTATRANALRNGVEGRISLCLPDEVDAARFDVVIANILAQPLIELSPRLKGLVQDGGALVMSGIMRSQMEWVMSAYPDIRFEAPLIVDDWVCIAGSRR
jgi:ribosomal protein L11 methyltransferase